MKIDAMKQEPAAGPVGRGLRILLGALLITSITPFYLQGEFTFILYSVLIVVALILVYGFAHYLLSYYSQTITPLTGSVVAIFPMIAVYFLGMGGGFIFGRGEGQLGVLTFLGISLVLAGVRGDPGCEVMTIPNAILRKTLRLSCLVFGSVDFIEKKRAVSRK